MSPVLIKAGEIFFDGKLYVSAHQAARTVGVTGDYIARLAKAGRIPARRLGRSWFVDREAVRIHFKPGPPSPGPM
jgi:excisionase family DNA binding protein